VYGGERNWSSWMVQEKISACSLASRRSTEGPWDSLFFTMQIDERSPHALHAGPLRHMRHRMLFAEGPCEASCVDSRDYYSSTRVVHLRDLSNSRPYKWLKLFLGLFNARLYCRYFFLCVRLFLCTWETRYFREKVVGKWFFQLLHD